MGDTATKIRIFSLAKELGMDSKVLIEHCRAAGLKVKGSALASISPEEKDIVLKHIENQGETEEATEEVPEAPSRDVVQKELGARMRSIRTMVPRELTKPGAKESAEGEPSGQEAATEAVAETPEAPTAEEPAAPAEQTPAAEQPAAEQAAAEEAAAEVTEAPEAEVPEETVESPAAEPAAAAEAPAEAEAAGEAKPERDEFSPIRREDYQPRHGAGRGKVREMRPRGTPTHSETPTGKPAETGKQKDKEEKEKGKAREKKPEKDAEDRGRSQAPMPGLAPMPAFKVPEKKKAEAPEPKAQKPEIRLTPEQLEGQSPLADRLRKSTDDKKTGGGKGGRKKDVEFTDTESRDRSKLGSVDSSRRARRQNRHQPTAEELGETRTRRPRPIRKKRSSSGPVELKTEAVLEEPITVRSLSEAIGRPAKQILTVLFKRGTMATINQGLDEETAWDIAAELGVDLEVKREQTQAEYLESVIHEEDPEELLVERPPVVTILGHVDHGKTTLLDKIRETNVVSGEAGGITQHIRAYQIEHDGRKVTFVDTPGHAAFGEMRARGANVTDIVVLVVAADDGVMPQTAECISHAKACEAPIIIAMNKCDLPDINEQKVLTELSTSGVQPHEWGGEIEVIRTSAISGDGIEDLLETIQLTAEISELKANPDRKAMGTCLEGFQSEGLGPIAWMIVQKGTLRVGDAIVCGEAFGRVRGLFNDRGEAVDEAGPSMPVKVTGLDVVPGAGDQLIVVDDIDRARDAAEEHRTLGRESLLASQNQPRTLDDILDAAREGTVQDLNVILKGDTPGSLEALRSEIEKFEHPEVRVKILHEAVGGVNESDVYLASASDAVIIAFHVIADDRARQLADREGVEIRRYDIIYEVVEQIKRTLEGLLIPEKVQVATGRALVLQTFSVSKFGTIAGCRVLNGKIERSNRVHVIRDQKVINDYPIGSLRRVKDDVKEVREGMECGIRLEGFNDVKEGDLLEAFRIDTVKRTLD